VTRRKEPVPFDDATFDRVMTAMLPKLKRLARYDLANETGWRTEIEHTALAECIQIRRAAKGETVEEAIAWACCKFEVSESTAWRAWRRSTAYLNDEKRLKKLLKKRLLSKNRNS
jgi:hypothetical protein